MSKKTLVIIGSGWAGYTLSQNIDDRQFNVVVVSPEPTAPYTPLLASAACGLFNFSLAEEPIRHKTRKVRFIQARVDDIDFDAKVCTCSPAFPDIATQTFELPYDIIVLAPGCRPNTFDTPGVPEHALFVRNVRDAMTIRQRLLEILERASLPYMTEDEQRALLHIIVVGGGPTGVEITAEITDLVRDDFNILYPHLAGKISVAIHDVADQILGVFDAKLAEHALRSFKNNDVQVNTGSHITKVEKDKLYTKEEGEIRYGMLIWATGNKQVSLVDSLKLRKSDRLPRVLTDFRLRPMRSSGDVVGDAYALGDAADIEGGELPTTAEVACQKARYLAKVLNDGTKAPFVYQQKTLVAYTGERDGVVAGKADWTGSAAWLAWRSGNLQWARSWRNKILITVNWGLDYIFGKEIARI